jgi:hypothetical protein
MFYNKDNPQWKFNEEQYLSQEEYYRFVDEYDELCRSMLSADIRDWNNKLYGIKETGTPEEQERKKKQGLIYAGIAMIVFASLVVSLIFKQILIFGFIACAVFLYVGISMIVTGRGEALESTSKAIMNRIIGACMSLASVSIALVLLFRSHFEGAELFLLIFVIVFGLAGLALVVITILKALSDKYIYTEEINATCAGYVRYVNREEGSNNRRFTFINTSPLFSYSYGGVQYEAVWDEFVSKKDSDIALGQTVPIRIDPRHPENIASPIMKHPGGIVFKIIMGAACIAVAVGLGIYLMNGSAKTMTVETEWNPVIDKINGDEKSKLIQVTDNDIESLYVEKLNITSEWYYEIGVVATKEITADGEVISFTDEAFNKVIYADFKAPEPGTKLLLYYTVEEERLEYGKGYKHSFASGDPDRFEYVGTHGAYINK